MHEEELLARNGRADGEVEVEGEGAERTRKRRRRWDAGGDAVASESAVNGTTAAAAAADTATRKRDRSALDGDGPEETVAVNAAPGKAPASTGISLSIDALAKAKAALEKQRELKAKLQRVSEKNAKAGAFLETARNKAKQQHEELLQRTGDGVSIPSSSGRTLEAQAKPQQLSLADSDGGGEGDGDAEDDNPFYDPAVAKGRPPPAGRRAPRSFNFFEPGELVKEAEKEREVRDILLRRHELARDGEADEADAFSALLTGPLGGVYGEVAPPAVEWWDKMLVRGGYAALGEQDGLVAEKITVYVEHPVPIEPPAEAPAPPPQPLILTKKERKKLRTQRRMAMEKEKQEMIRQGLMEPPKPKVKLSNMMRVLGESATADPTAVEAAVRAAALERQQAHEDRNLANKLTPAERRAKKDAKLHSDTSLGVSVEVYRLIHMRSGKQRFRIEVNAEENRLTGRIVRTPKFVIVVVEGGLKGIKRFHKLMTNRIKWDEDDEGPGDDAPVDGSGSADRVPNACACAWSGIVKTAAFEDFKYERCSTDYWAQKVFKDAGVPQYFDMTAKLPQA